MGATTVCYNQLMQRLGTAPRDATTVCYNAATYLEGGARLHSAGTDDGMTPFRFARPRVYQLVKDHPDLSQDELVDLAAAENIRVSQSTISHLRLQLKNGHVAEDDMTPFHHVRPAVIAILKANPRATQDEIVSLAAAQRIRISQSSVSTLRAQLRDGAEPDYYGTRHANRQVKALESIDADLAAKAAVLEHLFSEAKFEFTCDPATAAKYSRSIAASTSRIRRIVQILKEQGRKA